MGMAKERGFQDIFQKFLEFSLLEEVETHQYLVFDQYELDMWIDVKTPDTVTVSFIEMKMNDSNLENALLQAILYAYKYCSMKRIRKIKIVIAAVSLPNYFARVGVLDFCLDEFFNIKESSFEMEDPFSWETEEGAFKLAGHLLSRPEETEEDAFTDNAPEVATFGNEETGRPAPRRRPTRPRRRRRNQ
ncbi:MAG: uncharacterized protein A8A55_0329 [Amphiamblys sp. WSBS2006]|nr:MAG: uncharacterized protein A8A55_0329 [Amphiamblys sp. WSBS2006]